MDDAGRWRRTEPLRLTSRGAEVGLLENFLVAPAAAPVSLRHVARQDPVLVVLDDVQWLDPSSASVLGFVARRLETSPIRAARGREEPEGLPSPRCPLPSTARGHTRR